MKRDMESLLRAVADYHRFREDAGAMSAELDELDESELDFVAAAGDPYAEMGGIEIPEFRIDDK